MNTHRFSLILSGVSEMTPEIADALFEACDAEIEFNFRDGVAWLEVEREAPAMADAVTASISEVEGSGLGVRVIRVETEDSNTIAKINAELLGAIS